MPTYDHKNEREKVIMTFYKNELEIYSHMQILKLQGNSSCYSDLIIVDL